MMQFNLLAGNFDNVGKILESFMAQWWAPLLGVLGGAAGIIGVATGLKWILAHQSGDEQKIKQSKQAFVGVLIGILIVFVLAGIIPVIVASFQSWYENDAQEYTALLMRVL
ncbi:MAG: hypothetical protein HDQ88_05435 [Clostridia bacterium]|nr:hypothetical protein [Clostridia bacterium]